MPRTPRRLLERVRPVALGDGRARLEHMTAARVGVARVVQVRVLWLVGNKRLDQTPRIAHGAQYPVSVHRGEAQWRRLGKYISQS